MKTLLLSGYGLSIKVKNTRMVFSQGLDPFSDKKETLELPATACQFDKVVIQGKGFVSTAISVMKEYPNNRSILIAFALEVILDEDSSNIFVVKQRVSHRPL
ncbi:MAG: hypothetical protein WD884_00875 [Nitrosopumilaceae archaeon]